MVVARKALIVGIDYYEHLGELTGCVNDALAVRAVLERNADAEESPNFSNPKLMLADTDSDGVSRRALKDAVAELFDDHLEIALFYFAGHGDIDATGGFLCASDSEAGDDGLSLQEVMAFANKSPARNKVIVLDSCHSGAAGGHPVAQDLAEISDGMTILTASTGRQSAMEVAGEGVFTRLFVDAMDGAAANLVGEITPGSVYAHIDQSLGTWGQRPVFKTNVKRFVSLRQVKPSISRSMLRALPTVFPSPEEQFALDPSYEPERSAGEKANPKIPKPDPAHTRVFRILQAYARVDLVRPVDAEHMWHAAMGSKACELTRLGRHYWNLAYENRL